MYNCILEFTVGEVHGTINDVGIKVDRKIQVLFYLGSCHKGKTGQY